MKNPYLTNYGQNAYFWIFFEIYRDPKKQLKKKILFKKMKKKKKKKPSKYWQSAEKCAYQAFIIQNLDVMAFELGMKVQFANF
jgi:hypothetical protein